MILPIVSYGDNILKKKASDLGEDYPGLKELIANMYDTMYNASGVGLAAPQIGLSIRLFVTDAAAYEEEKSKNFKKVFINPLIVEEEGDLWMFNEGCLSIPNVREDVRRKRNVRIQYYDEDFEFHDETYSGLEARIIQHEYDHIEGILFIDRIPYIRKRLLKKRLTEISKGNIEVSYKMKFPLKK